MNKDLRSDHNSFLIVKLSGAHQGMSLSDKDSTKVDLKKKLKCQIYSYILAALLYSILAFDEIVCSLQKLILLR